jgi:hypothetical protein
MPNFALIKNGVIENLIIASDAETANNLSNYIWIDDVATLIDSPYTIVEYSIPTLGGTYTDGKFVSQELETLGE